MEAPQISEFIERLAGQFEQESPDIFTPETAFRELGSWSSMQALIVIASFDWDYQVTVSAEELSKCTTVRDLYQLVTRKLS